MVARLLNNVAKYVFLVTACPLRFTGISRGISREWAPARRHPLTLFRLANAQVLGGPRYHRIGPAVVPVHSGWR